MHAPILLTVYNRPIHTKRVIQSLIQNELAKDSELYIYSDGPKTPADSKNVFAVRRFIRKIRGFKKVTIVSAKENKGLANSIVKAVSDIVNKHGKIIVLEDDTLLQKYFLTVINQMLNYYSEDKRIGAVTAYMISRRLVKFPTNYKLDIFFNIRPTSVGWGTWKDRWSEVDWSVGNFETLQGDRQRIWEFSRGGSDLFPQLAARQRGAVDSWAIVWAYHFYKNNLVCVQTTKSYIDDIGYDRSGTNTKNENYFFKQDDLATKKVLDLTPYEGVIDWNLIKKYSLHFGFSWPYIKKKLLSKFGILLKF